ncbi:MAG: hypothetical protein MUC92_04655 [Fimbriimonadaceae bacterium]|nr:hypothetical protein [Fimbriimonadaceae bacterium]
MSLHTNSNGFQRKAFLTVNGPLDNDLVAFHVVVDVTSGGGVTPILPDHAIPPGHKAFLQGFSLTTDGNAWTGGESVSLVDGSDGQATTFATITQANLPTLTNPIRLGHLGTVTPSAGLASGSRAGRGISFARTGTFAGNATLKLAAWGVVRADQADQIGSGI